MRVFARLDDERLSHVLLNCDNIYACNDRTFDFEGDVYFTYQMVYLDSLDGEVKTIDNVLDFEVL